MSTAPRDELRARCARVREARIAAGKTQREMAEAAGMSESSYAHIEQGRQDVPASVYWVLERDLGRRFAQVYPDSPSLAGHEEPLDADTLDDWIARGIRSMVLDGAQLGDASNIAKIENGLATAIRWAIKRDRYDRL